MPLSPEEFRRLALAELDAVTRVARSIARNRADADDLVQETYLNAARAQHTFELQSFGIRPWLLKILHNAHFTKLRKDRREPSRGASSLIDHQAADISDPLSVHHQTVTDERIELAMSRLPEDLSTILQLWAIDELSYKEIADVVGIPIGTVMSRLHRARKRLTELLDASVTDRFMK